jgi:predicted permease
VEAVLSDLRYAFRSFRLAPAFFALVTGILAVGIAATVSVFSLVDGVLLRPLPYRDPARLVMLTSYAPKPPYDSNGSVSYTDFEQFRSKNRSFEELAATYRVGWSLVTLTGGAEPVKAQGAFVTPNLFSMFGRAPILGRTFTEEENRRAERVVVISEGLWRARFGSSPQVLGADLELSGVRWRVIGVMPSDFRVPFLDVQLWAPVLSHPDWNDKPEPQIPRQIQRWDVMARLKPGVSFVAAQAEVDSIENGLRAVSPETHPDNVRVVPLREHFAGTLRKPMWTLLGAVAFLLLITCSNVAHLFLARAAHRQRELAIRSALGAPRIRLFRQLLTEAITYSCIAGAVGATGSLALVPVLKILAPANTPLLDSVTLNARCLVFALAVSLFIGLLLGLAPAGRRSAQKLSASLNAAGRSSTEGRASRRFKSCLVASEFALAMVLLTGAGLLIRSFVSLVNVDLGFHPQNVLTIQVGLPNSTPAPKTVEFYRQVLQRISRLPGVTAVGGAGNLFFLDETRTHALRLVEGRPPEPKSSWKPLVWTQVAGDYFQAMGIALIRGRYFNAQDRAGAGPVAIVNETLAQRYWPGENPVGKRLKGFDPRGKHDDWVTVVGEVKDTRSGGLDKAPFSEIYEAQAQSGEQLGNLVVRTASDPAPLAAAARSLIHQANSLATVPSIETMEQLLDLQLMQRRFETWLIAVFSAMALALAALGVFAVMHYSVTAKRSEIGIRMALGARAGDIVRLILNQGTQVALTGVAAGTIIAMWSTGAIRGMLYQVRATDPLTFLGAALTLIAVALLACYGPAHRASRIDPMTALRQD